MESCTRQTVLITGFGPFENHPVNASWEAVSSLPKEKVENEFNVNILQIQLPVTYEFIDNVVSDLWKTIKPKLAIHVGVLTNAKQITLEKQAHRDGYSRVDTEKKCPKGGSCCENGQEVLTTQLNVEEIAQDINNAKISNVTAITSSDAGKFLCEYIFYKSLSFDDNRAIFVHVPDLSVTNSTDTAKGLEVVLKSCLTQLEKLKK